MLQRKARDSFAECISLLFCTTELSILEAINTETLAMKTVLLLQCSSSTISNDIPAVHLLSRCVQDATNQYAQPGVCLKCLQRSKHTVKAL